MPLPFYTIGHSTRSIEEFVELLKVAEIRVVADVRTVPRSRTNPQYNRDVLPDTLSVFHIDYEHIAALGGLRGHAAGIAGTVNSFWQNQSFHNYADYALSESFRAGLARLHGLGHAATCAIMCAEAMWWRCHRRIIADYLIAAGDDVFHIVGPGRIEPAHMTEAARAGPDGLTYPEAGPAVIADQPSRNRRKRLM